MTDEAMEFEINRPHNAGRLYNFLIEYKFNKALGSMPFSVKNMSVLDVCCGSGMISEYYAKAGAKVIGIDLSGEAIERAKTREERYNFEADFKVADAGKLSFPDNSFDIVSVHDGLHHLKNPQKAVSEMVRVAKKGVIIIEPAIALITRISVFLGISTDYEGEDFVYRFKKNELQEWFKNTGCKDIRMKRYIMYYPHQPGKLFKLFDFYPLFLATKISFFLINILLGKLGNKVQIIALK